MDKSDQFLDLLVGSPFEPAQEFTNIYRLSGSDFTVVTYKPSFPFLTVPITEFRNTSTGLEFFLGDVVLIGLFDAYGQLLSTAYTEKNPDQVVVFDLDNDGIQEVISSSH